MRRFTPILNFFLHSTVGTAVFAAIAIPAVTLNCCMDKLQHICDSRVLVLLGVGEYFLLIADLALFAVFLFKEGRAAATEIWTQPDTQNTWQTSK